MGDRREVMERKRRFVSALPLALLLVPCAAAATPGTARSPLVYGKDDRVEYYEISDATLRAFSSRVVAFVPSDLVSAGEGAVTLDAPSLAETASLCEGERFSDQPAPAFCSGLLVDATTVLTAAHCVRILDALDVRIVSGFQYESRDVLNALSLADVRGIDAVLAKEESAPEDTERVDYAWVRLDGPLAGSESDLPDIRIRNQDEPLSAGEAVTIVGYGAGVPLKVDGGGRVAASRRDPSDYFVTTTDAFHGSSGSPVLDAEGRLAGIDVRGGADYVPTNAGCNVIAHEQDSNETAQEQATYAFRALEGLCAVEPSNALCNSPAEPPPSGCACSAAPRQGRSGASIALLVGIVAAIRRSRRSHSSLARASRLATPSVAAQRVMYVASMLSPLTRRTDRMSRH